MATRHRLTLPISDTVAIWTSDDQTISFKRLDGLIRAFAGKLAASGVVSGDRVVVTVDNLAVRLCLWLALMRLGAVAVLQDDLSILAAAGIAIDHVVALPDQAKAAKGRIVFGQEWAQAVGQVDLPDTGDLLCASSGTTGRPKYMQMRPGATLTRVAARSRALGRPDGPLLLTLATGSGAALPFMLRSLLAGQGVIMPRSSPDETWVHAVAAGLREIAATPTMLADLADAAERLAPTSRPAIARIACGGGTVSEVLMRRAESVFGCPVTVYYGTTEVSVATYCEALHSGYETGLVGKPADGVEVAILDDAGNHLAAGQVGRIVLRVPEARRCLPYLNAEGPFDAEGWFVSGDIGRLRPMDRALVLTGRVAEMINTGGGNIAPSVVEAALHDIAGLRNAVAFGSHSDLGPDQLCVAVQLAPGADREFVAAAIGAALAPFTRLGLFVVDAFPMTANGKISRRDLRAAAVEGRLAELVGQGQPAA